MTAPQLHNAIHSAVIRILREERKRLGLTHYQIAPKAGLSASTLSLIDRELRHPTLSTLLMITEAMGIELSEVLAQASKEVRGTRKSKESKRPPSHRKQ